MRLYWTLWVLIDPNVSQCDLMGAKCPYRSLFVVMDCNKCLGVFVGLYASLCILMGHYISL